MSNGNGETLTNRLKTPANSRTPMEFWTFGALRALFRSDVAALEMLPANTSPSAPAERGRAVLFARDAGNGKAQICVRFPSGAVQILATEP